MHTWGGRPHDSQCRVTIEPDGNVAATLGSQDLGPGSRTVIGIVLAETMGLPLVAGHGQYRRQQLSAFRRLGRQHHHRRRFVIDAPRSGAGAR